MHGSPHHKAVGTFRLRMRTTAGRAVLARQRVKGRWQKSA